MVSFMSYLFKYILTLMNLTKIREGRKKKWDYKNIPPPQKKRSHETVTALFWAMVLCKSLSNG